MALDKTGILNALKLRTETVPIEGGDVIIKEITADEYMELFNSDAVKNKKGELDGKIFASILATRCIVDESGNRIFKDSDASALSNGSTAVYSKIAVAVKALNGLGTGKN